jgi:AraC-like DNA-binding protein
VFRCPNSGVEAYQGAWLRGSGVEHFHPEYQVTIGLSGQGQAHHRGAWQDIAPGDVLVFHPDEAHAILPAPASRQPWAFVSLYVPARWVVRRGAGPAASRGTLRRITLAAFEAVRGGDPRRGEAVAALGEALASLPRPGEETEVDGRARDARTHLLAHLDRKLSLTELAAWVGLSPGRLVRAFSSAFGVSPHAFHLQARVHRAKQLVASGAPLVEAAEATGFADQSHLTRHFARLQRVSPGRWSAAGKNVQDGV